jgi:amidophosphoribosyltransferase
VCGIVGFLNPDQDVALDLYRAAMALQHRGQDGAGLATFQDRFHHHSDVGLLADAFRAVDLTQFKGGLGVAHLRYATSGTGTRAECQPFILSYPSGLALVHNGNLTNDAVLRRKLAATGRLVNSASDSDTVVHLLARHLAELGVPSFSPEQILQAVTKTMAELEGAYSVVVAIAHHGLLAFRDPHGIRPLVMGRRDRGVAFASESVALEVMQAPLDRDVQPGEAIFIDLGGNLHNTQIATPTPAHCAFEYIYLARPESVMNGQSVSAVRERLGETLAQHFDGTADVAFDVPSSAEDAAIAFARAASVPYRKGIRRNHYVARSFIAANPVLRKETAALKFHLERRVISEQHVAVVDDSIVRGTTAQALVHRLRRKGAKTVSFFSAAPPVTHPCPYGVDMAVPSDLIAARLDPEGIRRYLQVDHLQYQQQVDLNAALLHMPTCTACFTGCYPTTVSQAVLRAMALQRGGVSGDAHGDRLPQPDARNQEEGVC